MARNRTGPDSRQDYPTPWQLVHAVEARFGRIHFDLAAGPENTKAPRFYSKGDDALTKSWHATPGVPRDGLQWLNPPFRHIDPWASKCAAEAQLGARVAFLVPASVGTQWFEDHVWKTPTGVYRSDIYFLAGRIVFEKDPYPKDCMIAVFSRMPLGVVEVWHWKNEKGPAPEELALF